MELTVVQYGFLRLGVFFVLLRCCLAIFSAFSDILVLRNLPLATGAPQFSRFPCRFFHL